MICPRASTVALTLVALAAACGGPSGPSPIERHDAEALRDVLAHDEGTADALSRADRLVEERRPVGAAEVIRGEAIPYAERTTRTIRELAIESPRGRSLQQRLLRACGRRVRALSRYASALATTEEDMELLQALHEHREAEDAVLALWDELDGLAGRARPSRSKARR